MMKGKKSHLKGVLLLLVLLFISLPLSAQDLSVRSFEQVANDATAMDEKYQRLDGNQNLAGLVKVIIPREGVEFDGGMVIDQKKWAMGEYWVWMADGATKLNVRVPGFHALEVNFRDYDFKMLHSKNTYKLVVNVPVFGAQSQDDGMGYLALTVEPKSATLTVNGQQHTTTNGEVTVLLPMGSYDYEVSSPNFTPQKGRVAIDGGTKQLNIRLTSSSAQLKVSCATSSAKIYVNEQFKGTGSWQGEVSPGYYKVEARLDGYRINSQTLELAASDNRSVNIPALEKLTGALNVNYSPIGSDVYVDGSKVGTTPGIFRNIALGSHKVEIRKEGYTALSQDITIKENQTTEVSGSLTANTSKEEVVETMPEFEVGKKGLVDFLSNNIRYPMIAQECGVQGKIKVRFVVDRDGTVDEVQIAESNIEEVEVRDVENGNSGAEVYTYTQKKNGEVYLTRDEYNSSVKALEKEAIRVVKAMSGKWKPGSQNGKPIRVKYTIPLTFKCP